MTDEQIKQKAEAWIKPLIGEEDGGYNENDVSLPLIKNAYIGGAHSRDEEIEELHQEVNELSQAYYGKCAEVDKLRNPWISIEERLPKEGQCVFVRYGDATHSLYSSAYMLEKDLWSIEGYGNGEVTHWMPIPELKK